MEVTRLKKGRRVTYMYLYMYLQGKGSEKNTLWEYGTTYIISGSTSGMYIVMVCVCTYQIASSISPVLHSYQTLHTA